MYYIVNTYQIAGAPCRRRSRIMSLIHGKYMAVRRYGPRETCNVRAERARNYPYRYWWLRATPTGAVLPVGQPRRARAGRLAAGPPGPDCTLFLEPSPYKTCRFLRILVKRVPKWTCRCVAPSQKSEPARPHFTLEGGGLFPTRVMEYQRKQGAES